MASTAMSTLFGPAESPPSTLTELTDLCHRLWSITALLDSGHLRELYFASDKTVPPILYIAVACHDADLTRAVLSLSDVDIDKVWHNTETALGEACRQGNTALVRMLVDAGATVSSLRFPSYEPLLRKWQTEHDENHILHLLLNAGFDPNTPDRGGDRLLNELITMSTAQTDSLITQCVARHANPNLPDSDGVSAYQVAVTYDCLDVLRLFLERAPPPTSFTASDVSDVSVMDAPPTQLLPVLENIMDTCNVHPDELRDYYTTDGTLSMTRLHSALQCKEVEMVRFLLARGATPTPKDKRRMRKLRIKTTT